MSQHIETIGLSAGHAHCKRLLKFLESSTLPNLKNLDGFPWDALAVHIPPPHLVRPRLDSLTVLQLYNVPDFSPAFPWFDLSGLRMLEITANLDDKNTRRAIQEASPALEELGLHLFEMEDYTALVACLGRFKSLKTLKLYVQNWTSPLDAALLNSLPALQHLTMYHGGLSSAWVVPHASLQTLSLESPPPTFELDPADGDGDGSSDDTLYRNITALCQTIKEDPSAYPALRNVSVPSSYEQVSFATEESRGAVVLRLGKVLGELQAAGLRLVDDEGLEWREEWVGNQDDCGLPKNSAPGALLLPFSPLLTGFEFQRNV